MKRTRRTEITVETARVVVVSATNMVFGRCSRCGAERSTTRIDDPTAIKEAFSGETTNDGGEQHSAQTRETAAVELAAVSHNCVKEE